MKYVVLLTAIVGALALALMLPGCSQEAEDTGWTPVGSLEKVTVGSSGTECHVLYAGQDIPAGTVCYHDIDTDRDGVVDALQVCYSTRDCWELTEIHFAIGTGLSAIPVTKKGNPIPGKFPYSFTLDPGTTEWCFVIPFSDFKFKCGDIKQSIAYVAAHAALVNTCNGNQTETGWGDGKGFEGGSWAEWTTLTIDCKGDGTPEKCETAFAGIGKCFLTLDLDGVPGPDFDRWGWSLTPIQIGINRFPLYLDADGCEPGRAVIVGELTVDFDGSQARVTYSMYSGYTMDETNLYIGSEVLPRNGDGDFTVAPADYPYSHDLAGATTDVYYVTGLRSNPFVIAHAVVCAAGR